MKTLRTKYWIVVAIIAALVLPMEFAGAVSAGAVDYNRGSIGASWNYHKKAAARRRAITEARRAGGRNINLVFVSKVRGVMGLAFGRSSSGRGMVAYGVGFRSKSALQNALFAKLRSMGATGSFHSVIGKNTKN